MKKSLALLLCLVLCLTLWACEGKKQPHTHSYGQWTADKLPTADTTGTAKRTCQCGVSEEKNLPALTDAGYTITDNTANTVNAGTGKYTITVDGATITFQAATPVKEPAFEDVVSSPDFMAALALAGGEKAKPTEDLTVGKFTFGAGVYFESSNTSHFDTGNVNTQKKDITFTLQGTVNSIQFDMRGASSSGCVLTIVRLVEGGEPVQVYQSEELASGDFRAGVKITDLEPGTYVIQTSGSARIGDFFVTERMLEAEPVAIAVKVLDNQFLAGRPITSEGLTVELVYGNGRRDVLAGEDYEVDLAGVDGNTPGVYTASVTHKATGFAAEYDLEIYGVYTIYLSDHSLSRDRITLPVQKLYLAGSTYDNYDNLAVTAVCQLPGGPVGKEFVLQEGEYTCTPATVEDPRITVTAGGASASYDVTILSLSDKVSRTQVIVDQSATPGEGADGVVTVKSVNDALKLLELLDAPKDQRKTITICPGTYWEKVDVSMPKLSIVAQEGAKAEDIVIIYDALNGISDPSGTSGYSTDGSATFSLRAGAKGFYAQGFTIMNFFNTHEAYEFSKTLAGSGTQAVALLVRCDKAVFEDMRFSSYQDTLYAENGRHIYRNCYIEGRTDYIFGNNATAYFTGCTIRSIGAGVEEKNGGYVVTTKGGKSGETVEYGFIFDGCTFEGDENVQPGSVSLARGWDQYMTMMVMNSRLDDSFSLEAYGDTSSPLNDRYTKMNADPVAEQLFEYNNTGAGALPGNTAGTIEALCTIPTPERAKDFADFSKIFAKTNGEYIYADAWDGEVR